uniref:Integrase catalytic domain-containing protein n=1 Tax=Tanacetum cinerariifolium TaxID=118510 RepID=A0A6L2M8D4_TANCI|nr:hypothetical protein [Tanacetum cinerariifolium]
MIKVLPPKTVEEVVARERERKARTTLLMALLENHLAKFHKMADAKEKFLRSLPSSWSQVAWIIRTQPGLDTLSFNDLYNNLRVFERDVKGTIASSSNTHNVAFVSADNTSSTNDVSTAYSVSSPSVLKSQKEGSSSYTDEVIHSFFSNQSSSPQLDYDDLEQINNDDMEEIDLKWQLVLIRPKWNPSIAIKWGILLETAELKGTKTAEEEMIEGDLENTSVNDRYAAGMHAVSPPMTGNYMPCRPDVEIDYSKFTYGGDNDSVSNVQEDKEKPSFAFTDSVKHVKTFRENVGEKGTPNHSPKVEKQDRNGPIRKGLGYAFTRKACFVCGSFSHLIRDCDFYEKRMAKQAELTKSKNKGTKLTLLIIKNLRVAMLPLEKGKQHKASCKAKIVSLVNQPLQILHMDLFGPTSDGTTPILKDFIRQAEKQFNHKVKTIRSDNGTEFKNNELIEFCGLKGIKREYSNARTSQQNGVAERKNKTLIKAARTMVLVTNPQNKTPYELLTGKQPIISYLRPFRCYVTILNTINQLGKFDGKSDLGFLVGYSLNSKAFRVYNLETKRVEENLHVNFLENKPNVAGKGHAWMFDLDYLTSSIYYEPVSVENQANKFVGPKEANNSAGTQANDDQDANSEEIDLHEENFVLPIWSAYSTTVKSSEDKIEKNIDFKTCEKPVSQVEQIFLEELEKLKRQKKEANVAARKETTNENSDAHTNSTKLFNTVSTPLSTTGPSRAFNDGEPSYPNDPLMPQLVDIYASPSERIFTNSSYDDEGVVTDFNNLETTVNVSLTLTTRIYTIHPKT